MKKIIYIACITATSALLSSCGKDPQSPGLEFMPDMYRSSSYEVYGSNPFFADSLAMQKPVAGTVSRGYEKFSYPSTNEGYVAAGNDLKNPFPPTAANLAEGQAKYEIFCMHCHGAAGEADGSLIATGKFPPPPSYTTGNSSRGGAMKDLSDGKIFHTITYGINLMGPHAMLLNPEERWKITMYVRNLMNGGMAAAPADTASAAAPTATTN